MSAATRDRTHGLGGRDSACVTRLLIDMGNAVGGTSGGAALVNRTGMRAPGFEVLAKSVSVAPFTDFRSVSHPLPRRRLCEGYQLADPS